MNKNKMLGLAGAIALAATSSCSKPSFSELRNDEIEHTYRVLAKEFESDSKRPKAVEQTMYLLLDSAQNIVGFDESPIQYESLEDKRTQIIRASEFLETMYPKNQETRYVIDTAIELYKIREHLSIY